MIVIFDVLILVIYIFNSVKKIRKKKIMMTWPLIWFKKKHNNNECYASTFRYIL